jgi:hypothetical protein
VSDTDRLAALLHEEHDDILGEMPCRGCASEARRLIASGVTLAATPAPPEYERVELDDGTWYVAAVHRALDRHPWVFDTLPSDVQEAINTLEAATPAPLDVTGDDFRDRHERAMRDHILARNPEHCCDDLCSDEIITRLAAYEAPDA